MWIEVSAEVRRDAKEFEGAGSDIVRTETEIAVTVRVDHVIFRVAYEPIENMILMQVILELRVGVLIAAAAFLIIRIVEVMDGHDNEIALVLVREGLKEGIIDDAEDGGGSTDAKGEGKDGDECEAAVFPQAAERKLKIPDKNI
jgi:hypothetical protein